MKNFLLSLLFFSLLPFTAHAQETISGLVIRVVDGDTIRVREKNKEITVRLYGIDAPESKQAGGAEATEFLRDLLLTNQVALEVLDTDRYGRKVAIVVLRKGVVVQDEILKAGHAWVYAKYCKAPQCKGWNELERQAQELRAGLWAEDAVPPWEWRRR